MSRPCRTRGPLQDNLRQIHVPQRGHKSLSFQWSPNPATAASAGRRYPPRRRCISRGGREGCPQVCVCSFMRYNSHTYSEGTAWLTLTRKSKVCSLSDISDSQCERIITGTRLREPGLEPEPIPQRATTKEGSKRRTVDNY